MERQGGVPRLWAERCVKKGSSEIRGQVMCSRFLEVICRRIAVLVEAHSQPSRPNWTAARYLKGAPVSEQVMLTGLRSGAMRRAKEEVEIPNAQQRSYTRSSANDDDKDVRDGKGANKKWRRGRVLSAPDG